MLKFNRIIQLEKPRLKNTIFALKPSINVDCLVSDVSEFLREEYLNNNYCLKLMIVFPSSWEMEIRDKAFLNHLKPNISQNLMLVFPYDINAKSGIFIQFLLFLVEGA